MAVMVWIHGGGFGLGSSQAYPGGVLAAFNDVIVVSISYRVGVLGFLNIPGTDYKGNFGMLDQVIYDRDISDEIFYSPKEKQINYHIK